MNTVRLARTYWEIPSSFFEIGVKYGPRACGSRSILNPNFSEFRWYFPIRPRQTHSILSLLSILLEAYIDVPPMYFPIPGHPLGNENILLSCPPPVLHNTWGGHDSRKFLVSCPPPVLSNTGGGHDSKNIFSIMSPPCIGQYRGGT